MPFRKPDHRVPLGKPAAQEFKRVGAHRIGMDGPCHHRLDERVGPGQSSPRRRGVQPAIVRMHSRVWALSVILGRCRRSLANPGLRREPDLDEIRRFRGLALRAHQTRRQLGVDLGEAVSPQHVGRGHVGHQTSDERAGFGLVAHHHPAHNRMIAAGIGMKRPGRNRIDDLVRHDAHAAQPRDGGMFVVVG